jgi:hypothetical protein
VNVLFANVKSFVKYKLANLIECVPDLKVQNDDRHHNALHRGGPPSQRRRNDEVDSIVSTVL